MEYFSQAVSRWSDFETSDTRQEYWMFILFYILIAIALSVVDAFLTGGLLSLVYVLVALVPYIAATTRRLHDTGRTGWWQLVSFIPGIGVFILLFLLVLPSNPNSEYA